MTELEYHYFDPRAIDHQWLVPSSSITRHYVQPNGKTWHYLWSSGYVGVGVGYPALDSKPLHPTPNLPIYREHSKQRIMLNDSKEM